MSNKLIGLSQLQEYKAKSDLKYQDKLTAGTNISIVNDVISSTVGAPTFVAALDTGSETLTSDTITNLGQLTLLPGKYIISYTCTFKASVTTSGYVQCGFSTNTTDITGFGRAWGDTQNLLIYSPLPYVQTAVSGTFEVTDANGKTFYLLARSSIGITVYPRCYYIKF